jgi:glyceraldehyde 3-phosphate dehydrogenase
VAIRVGINGFGRIGRLVFRLLLEHTEIEVLAINDLVSADNLAYLLKYDSTHGQISEEITTEDNLLRVGLRQIRCFNEKDPLNLPWKDLGVDFVIESTGHFTQVSDAKVHLLAGAKYVIITAPGKGEIPTFVYGVNHHTFNPTTDNIISNASCTTNCLATLSKVLLDSFGIEEGLMTTIHAVTASQHTVDSPSKKDFRSGRGAWQNIVPSSTGAAKAVALCLPELKGKLTGMSFRVPVPDVSVVDLTVRLSRSATYDEVCQAIKTASETNLKGLMAYTEEPVVSSDFIGSRYSSIFDRGAGIALNDRFFKLVAWYDNEMGYSQRVVDLLAYIASRV